MFLNMYSDECKDDFISIGKQIICNKTEITYKLRLDFFKCHGSSKG